MKTFHHGGRFGDLFYALWTMKELGGGKLFLSDFHAPGWSLEMAKTLKTFLELQPFIQAVEFVPYSELPAIDYDLQLAEGDFNPEAFPENPELGHHLWPGNANIAKRYAVHFGLTYRPGEKWLEAPGTTQEGVCCHYKYERQVRSLDDWLAVIMDKRVSPFVYIGEEYGDDWLTTATKINSCKVFLGVVSGPHALAEGLGKTRLVEQADGCFNVSVLPPSRCINGWSNELVIEEVRKFL